MKAITKIAIYSAFLFIMSGCEDYNEAPPRSVSNIRDYVLPKAQPLTDSDRLEVNDRQKEYEESLL